MGVNDEYGLGPVKFDHRPGACRADFDPRGSKDACVAEAQTTAAPRQRSPYVSAGRDVHGFGPPLRFDTMTDAERVAEALNFAFECGRENIKSRFRNLRSELNDVMGIR